MTLKSKYPGLILESGAAFEMFRRLGYRNDELTFCATRDGEVGMLLEHNGLSFGLKTGQTTAGGINPETLPAMWLRFATDWKEADESDIVSIFEESQVRAEAVQILAKLQAEGMYPPQRPN